VKKKREEEERRLHSIDASTTEDSFRASSIHQHWRIPWLPFVWTLSPKRAEVIQIAVHAADSVIQCMAL